MLLIIIGKNFLSLEGSSSSSASIISGSCSLLIRQKQPQFIKIRDDLYLLILKYSTTQENATQHNNRKQCKQNKQNRANNL